MSTSEQPEMIVHTYSISITNRAICSRVAFIPIAFSAYKHKKATAQLTVAHD